MSSRSPCILPVPTTTALRGIVLPATAIGSSRRSLTVCPSVTLCAPCTHAGMVFRSDTSVVPTAVLNPRLRSCEKVATNSALLMGCARKETIWRVTCLTGVAVFFFPFCTVEGSAACSGFPPF